MRRAELFLLLLLPLSYALVDPPVDEVRAHNTAIAPHALVTENALHVDERIPSLNDPSTFRYLRILTLNPSVNGTVTGKEAYHPELIWMLAEDHPRSLTAINGRVVGYEVVQVLQYANPALSWGGSESGEWTVDDAGNLVPAAGSVPVMSWSDVVPTVEAETPDEGEGCEKTIVKRTYGPLNVTGVTAHYYLDGIIKKEPFGGYRYDTAEQSVELAGNGTSFTNPSGVPFRPTLACALLGTFSHFLLADMINLDCNEDTLIRASPYAVGTYNFTVRNMTVVQPHLNVTLTGAFTIPYDEHGIRYYEDEDGSCVSESWDGEGTLRLGAAPDFRSYEVQNEYMTLMLYSPHFMSFSANTSEDVPVVFSLAANPQIYKYYSTMDNRTATFKYFNSFRVAGDSFGTQFIIAEPANETILFAEDPRAGSRYSGNHTLLSTKSGTALRNAAQFNNITYNHSRVYEASEFFYNLSDGPHALGLEFYTWFGSHNASINLSVWTRTQLSLVASMSPAGGITATCSLTGRGMPVPGAEVVIRFANQSMTSVTGQAGTCTASFPTNASAALLDATFAGRWPFLPSTASAMLISPQPFAVAGDLGFSFPLLLLLGFMLAVMAFNSMNSGLSIMAGGAAVGGIMGKMFPFAPRGLPKGKKTVRVKKGKELAMSVAMALATGGASAGAGGKLVADIVKKEMAQKAAAEAAKKQLARKGADALKKKMIREMAEKGGKKPSATGKKQNLMALLGPPGSPNGGASAEDMTAARAILDNITTKEEHRIVLKKVEMIRGMQKAVIQMKTGIPAELLNPPSSSKIIIASDAQLEAAMRAAKIPETYIQQTAALTDLHTKTIYLRESRINDPVYLVMAVTHEHYHTISKIPCDTWVHMKIDEGFNELMRFEDIQLLKPDKSNPDSESLFSDEMRRHAAITEPYRPLASEQYVLREIIGRQEYHSGHLVNGESNLVRRLDAEEGKGTYDRIFGGHAEIIEGNEAWVDNMSHDARIHALREIYAKKHTEAEQLKVFHNIYKIEVEGRYVL